MLGKAVWGVAGLLLLAAWQLVREYLAAYFVAHPDELGAFISSPWSTVLLFLLLALAWWFYWFRIDKRNQESRRLATRWNIGLERLITRDYKDDKSHVLSEDGAKHEDAPDHYRRMRYEQAGLLDLFRPSPDQGHRVLTTKADEGQTLLDRALEHGQTEKWMEDVRDWERLSAEDVRFYAQNWAERNQARAYAKRTIVNRGSDEERVAVLKIKIEDLRFYAGREGREARKRAERLEPTR